MSSEVSEAQTCHPRELEQRLIRSEPSTATSNGARLPVNRPWIVRLQLGTGGWADIIVTQLISVEAPPGAKNSEAGILSRSFWSAFVHLRPPHSVCMQHPWVYHTWSIDIPTVPCYSGTHKPLQDPYGPGATANRRRPAAATEAISRAHRMSSRSHDVRTEFGAFEHAVLAIAAVAAAFAVLPALIAGLLLVVSVRRVAAARGQESPVWLLPLVATG